ncbi:hypothetical protein CK203_111452 [Vitis vinifera]|uniref:Reverse transcriptase/retrotransposon-derived protein RNase H-like domain-containing protein n=1 Tax=Vitis vinifera TaxID=29760 RepID=A0A438BPD9_VITVI|nr:hypothetical protein CK203_111452 [Vitis vinifera]
MIDEAIPCDEYNNEMLMVDTSQITDDVHLKTVSPLDLFEVLAIEMVEDVHLVPAPGLLTVIAHDDDVFEGVTSPVVVESEQITDDVQPETASPLYLFGVLAIEMVEDVHLVLAPGLLTVVAHDDDVFEGVTSLVVVESEHVDPPLSFDVLLGFVSLVEYPEWLANVIPVPKKDDHVRVCVNFRDLNKASLKDDCPIAHIDMLVDSTTGHSLLSFMDRVMLVGLKNARATYQKATTTFFHDMMHQDVEIETESQEVHFWSDFGKLLRYMVSERDTEADSDKIRAILDMPALRIEREIRGFLTKFDIHYVTQNSIRESIVVDHLASLPVSNGRVIDDSFPDEDIAAVTSLSGWRMYFDGTANHSGYEISVLLIFLHGDHIPRSVRLASSDRHPTMNNIVEEHNQFADALTTLASMIDIPIDTVVCPLLIESRSIPAYCCLIDKAELDDVWGIDIIGKISPKSSTGHEFILVAIDYFTSGWRLLHMRD